MSRRLPTLTEQVYRLRASARRAQVRVQSLLSLNRGDCERLEEYISKLRAEVSQLHTALTLYKSDEIRQARAIKIKAWFGGGNDS